MKDDQCCLSFYDLQERPICEVKLSENFLICTWKVRAAFALCTGSLRILYTDFFFSGNRGPEVLNTAFVCWGRRVVGL